MQSIEDAIKHILASIKAIDDSDEVVPLALAHHRVLAEAPRSTIDVPPADHSAMDGYALHSDDLPAARQQGLSVSQRIPAGTPAQPLQAHTMARIFTGSQIPAGADTVVIQENCEVKDGRVRVVEEARPGAHIRRRGQDIRAGRVLFETGHLLLPQDMGLLASVGLAEVKVKRKVKVAILSSGDELCQQGQPLAAGQIYNSNRYTLHGLLSTLDVEVLDAGVVADSLDATKAALLDAAGRADAVVTTGGVSVGEEDHLKAAVETVGELELWKLKIKPGKPLAFGFINRDGHSHNRALYFGLPGNPVAVFVTFLLIVRPALIALQGREIPPITTLRLPCNFSLSGSSRRQEYLRVRIENNRIEKYPTQDSSVLTSTVWANALAVVPADTPVSEGDGLEVIPYAWFNL